MDEKRDGQQHKSKTYARENARVLPMKSWEKHPAFSHIFFAREPPMFATRDAIALPPLQAAMVPAMR